MNMQTTEKQVLCRGKYKKTLIAAQDVFTACSLLARSEFALLSPDLCTNPKDLLLTPPYENTSLKLYNIQFC